MRRRALAGIMLGLTTFIVTATGWLSTPLTAAAKTGAMENVRINLESIQDQKFRASIEARLGALKT